MKPRIFIASSSNCKDHIEKLSSMLEHKFECVKWYKEGFDLSAGTLESLENRVNDTDAGIFLFSLDDTTFIDNDEKRKIKSVRDNVILEFGMWVGRHGRKRAVVVCPELFVNIMVSDLQGTTVLAVPDSFTPDDAVGVSGQLSGTLDKVLSLNFIEGYLFNKPNLLSTEAPQILNNKDTYGLVIEAPRGRSFVIKIARLDEFSVGQEDICWGFPIASLPTLENQLANDANRTRGTQLIYPRHLAGGIYACDLCFRDPCKIEISVANPENDQLFVKKSFSVIAK